MSTKVSEGPLSPRLRLVVAAVVEIASSAQPVSAGALARSLGLARRALEESLQLLARAGVLSSARGPSGGYLLASAPHTVSVGEVLRVILRASVWSPATSGNIAREFDRASAAAWRIFDSITIEALQSHQTDARSVKTLLLSGGVSSD